MDAPKPDPSLIPFLTGFAGALVSLKWMPGGTWLEKAFTVLCGLLTAGICTPYFVHRFQVTGEHAQYFVGFGIGMFGLAFLSAVREGLEQADVKGLVARFVRRRIGGQEDSK
jgi:hypothetical protein